MADGYGMHTLTAAELLDVWEAGRDLAPLDQAGLLLLAAFPDLSWPKLEALPLGRREALLIQLREALFGPGMEGVAACPACGERLAFTFSGDDLGAGVYPALPELVEVKSDGYDLTLRLPTTADIRAAAGQGDRLFAGLLLSASHDKQPVEPDRLPPAVVAAAAEVAAEAVQAADPLADITFALDCPACSHQWQASFEAIFFLWREIETWAWRTLHTVHTLAARYGWREADILAMSARRRQLYLEFGSE